MSYGKPNKGTIAVLRSTARRSSAIVCCAIAMGPVTAAMMTFAAHSTGSGAAFDATLDSKLGGAAAGDGRAILLLAKADSALFSESGITAAPENLPSQQFATQALAAAESTNLQAEIIEWIGRQVAARQGDQAALNYLNGATAALQGPSATSLRKWVTHVAADLPEEEAHNHEPFPTDSPLQGQLQSLKQQLARATAQGRSAEDLQSLQTLIDNTQNQLNARGATTAPSP